MMAEIQASVADLLKGRDMADPDDVAILLECMAVLAEARLGGLEPVVLAAALDELEDTAVSGPPELAKIRLAWLAYLRAVTGTDEPLSLHLDLNPN